MTRLLIAAMLASTATPAVYADTRNNQMAYDYALRCFVAGGLLAADRRNDPAALASATKGARRAFDTVHKMGLLLGYSDEQVSSDLDSYQRTEARHMTADDSYYRSTQANCIKLGLL